MFSIMVSCGCGVQGSWAWRASNLFFNVIAIGWGFGLLFCFIFSFFSSCSSCASLSSPFKFSCFEFIFFLLTRFGGGLSFRVFCAAVLMLLSLIICCFSIFLLIPFFVGLMADSASLVSISFLSFSIFILFVEWLMLSLFFHCLALFLFFFSFFFCSLTVYCALYSLPRSVFGLTPVYPLGISFVSAEACGCASSARQSPQSSTWPSSCCWVPRRADVCPVPCEVHKTPRDAHLSKANPTNLARG